MANYRRKAILVDAVQYAGHGNMEGHTVPDWIWKAFEHEVLEAACNNIDLVIHVDFRTHLVVAPGCWVIKDDEGNIFACSAELFARTYESIE